MCMFWILFLLLTNAEFSHAGNQPPVNPMLYLPSDFINQYTGDPVFETYNQAIVHSLDKRMSHKKQLAYILGKITTSMQAHQAKKNTLLLESIKNNFCSSFCNTDVCTIGCEGSFCSHCRWSLPTTATTMLPPLKKVSFPHPKRG